MIIEFLLFFTGLALEWGIDFVRDWITARRLAEEEEQHYIFTYYDDEMAYVERRTGVSNIVVGTYSTLMAPGLHADIQEIMEQ